MCLSLDANVLEEIAIIEVYHLTTHSAYANYPACVCASRDYVISWCPCMFIYVYIVCMY